MNLPLEILAALPKHPRYARMRDLASDLGLRTQDQLCIAIDSLKSRGFQVCVGLDNGSRVVNLMPASWERAQAEAEEYWRETYEVAT